MKYKACKNYKFNTQQFFSFELKKNYMLPKS